MCLLTLAVCEATGNLISFSGVVGTPSSTVHMKGISWNGSSKNDLLPEEAWLQRQRESWNRGYAGLLLRPPFLTFQPLWPSCFGEWSALYNLRPQPCICSLGLDGSSTRTPHGCWSCRSEKPFLTTLILLPLYSPLTLYTWLLHSTYNWNFLIYLCILFHESHESGNFPALSIVSWCLEQCLARDGGIQKHLLNLIWGLKIYLALTIQEKHPLGYQHVTKNG